MTRVRLHRLTSVISAPDAPRFVPVSPNRLHKRQSPGRMLPADSTNRTMVINIDEILLRGQQRHVLSFGLLASRVRQTTAAYELGAELCWDIVAHKPIITTEIDSLDRVVQLVINFETAHRPRFPSTRLATLERRRSSQSERDSLDCTWQICWQPESSAAPKVGRAVSCELCRSNQ